MGLVFNKLYITEVDVVLNNILYLQKVFKKYLLKQGFQSTARGPFHSAR